MRPPRENAASDATLSGEAYSGQVPEVADRGCGHSGCQFPEVRLASRDGPPVRCRCVYVRFYCNPAGRSLSVRQIDSLNCNARGRQLREALRRYSPATYGRSQRRKSLRDCVADSTGHAADGDSLVIKLNSHGSARASRSPRSYIAFMPWRTYLAASQGPASQGPASRGSAAWTGPSAIVAGDGNPAIHIVVGHDMAEERLDAGVGQWGPIGRPHL